MQGFGLLKIMCVNRFYIPLLIQLANEVEMNPGPCYHVDCCKPLTADYK